MYLNFSEFRMDTEEKTDEIRKMAKKIYESIAHYFHGEIIHTIRRVLAAEMKHMYVGPLQGIHSMIY